MDKERRKKKMKNRKIDQKLTKQIVVDVGWHTWLKKRAAEEGTAIKTLVEGYLAEHSVIGNDNK